MLNKLELKRHLFEDKFNVNNLNEKMLFKGFFLFFHEISEVKKNF